MKLQSINRHQLASVQFTLRWNSDIAKHTDSFFARKVNLWRDVFPENISYEINKKKDGGLLSFSSLRDKFIADHAQNFIFRIMHNQFDLPSLSSRNNNHPHFGCFYPKGLLKGFPGIFKGNLEPFRCVGVYKHGFAVDLNHPLSGKNVDLALSLFNIRERMRELGGLCEDWIGTVTEGPGMQARWNRKPTDFFNEYSFRRDNEQIVTLFYLNPRLVTHVDSKARFVISGLYGRLLHKGMKVLDLMSSWQSHVPETLQLSSLIGVGLNEKELESNKQLTAYRIHNLNESHALSFQEGTFDAVICSVSIEYLTDPLSIFKDVGRVLKTGGIFIITFSNRWFPQKAVNVWKEIHEFERVGLVLEYFARSGLFSRLETFSIRGLPRPENDQYYMPFSFSDPVYAVWGYKV